jgi:hypothetical protein
VAHVEVLNTDNVIMDVPIKELYPHPSAVIPYAILTVRSTRKYLILLQSCCNIFIAGLEMWTIRQVRKLDRHNQVCRTNCGAEVEEIWKKGSLRRGRN